MFCFGGSGFLKRFLLHNVPETFLSSMSHAIVALCGYITTGTWANQICDLRLVILKRHQI